MCSRQEDYHRGVARELLHHVTTRGGKLRLADIAEPGPSCSTVSCAEAVRVALRLEQWILEGFTTARDTALKVGYITGSLLLGRLELKYKKIFLMTFSIQLAGFDSL